MTRDLPVGVSVPVKGFENKKIYVWIEAVSGYYSASKQWEKETGGDASACWNEDAVSYYVQGKDNIPFHTIVWPAVLLGIDIPALPTHVLSNEYLTLEKKKLSTSRNWAVWAPEIIERYDPDSIRYFLTVNAPENHDSDFSWREFIYSHNSELLGAYGNFVNRTLKFINKIEDFEVRQDDLDQKILNEIGTVYKVAGRQIKALSTRSALVTIFSFIRHGNKYFDEQQPWQLYNHDRNACRKTLNNCLNMIANLAQLLSPFVPFSSQKIRTMLQLRPFTWKPIDYALAKPQNIQPLFARIDLSRIDEEVQKLHDQEKA